MAVRRAVGGPSVPRRGLTVSHLAGTPVADLRHLSDWRNGLSRRRHERGHNTHSLLAQNARAPVFTGADLLERG